MKKATFWQRMGVYLIDMVVLAVESFPFSWQGSGGASATASAAWCFCLSFLWMLFDPRKDAWHDRIFGFQIWQD